MLTRAVNPLCTYNLLENGIHEFTYHAASTATIDAYFEQLTSLYRGASPQDTIHIILNVGSHNLSLPYFFKKFRQWVQWIKATNVYPQSRFVLLHEPSEIISLVDLFLKPMRLVKFQMRFFMVAQYADAMEWLLLEP